MTNSNYILIVATLLAAIGMWLLLPRGTKRGWAVGVVLVVIGFGLGASQMPYLGDWVYQCVFSILASVTVIAAAATFSCRNPVYCAIWFGLSLLGVAGLFLLTGAQFLGVATIVVYAGAILVTFLFVLMLARQDGKAIYDRTSWEAPTSAVTGMVIVGILSLVVGNVLSNPTAVDVPPISAPNAEMLAEVVLAPDHMATFGMELFGRHLIAIEVAGTLLLASLIGAAVIVAQSQRVQGSEFRVQNYALNPSSESRTPYPEP
jgi:NADH-quinone oxidoreductase subunit J